MLNWRKIEISFGLLISKAQTSISIKLEQLQTWVTFIGKSTFNTLTKKNIKLNDLEK